MGSVISDIQCPNCKSETCQEDYYYKTDEVYTFCMDCGYTRNITIKRDENGVRVLKDPTKECTLDNFVYESNCIEKPYGVGSIEFRGGAGQMRALLDDDDYGSFVNWVNQLNKAESKIRKVSVSRYVEDHFEYEVLYWSDIHDDQPREPKKNAYLTEEDDSLPF